MSPTANQIIELLHKKHPVDKFLCVEECKIGSTWFKERCSRLDMWVMARSYAHPRFIGCEIKVNRQDFLRDNKWTDYLPYCTEFWFVAPHGIIDVDEVPEQAGLLLTSKNHKLLITKKKAPVRNIEIPPSIFVYILMSRTQIVSDMFNRRSSVEVWRDRLKELKSNKKMGRDIAWYIRQGVEKRVKEIQDENRALKSENQKLQRIHEYLKEKGVDLDEISSGYGIKRNKLDELITGLPYNLYEYLRLAEKNICMAADAIKKETI